MEVLGCGFGNFGVSGPEGRELNGYLFGLGRFWEGYLGFSGVLGVPSQEMVFSGPFGTRNSTTFDQF